MDVGDIKNYVEVINKLIRRYVVFPLLCRHTIRFIFFDLILFVIRYKYLQRPLEESALPTLLQYVHRWPAAQTDKFATAVGLLLAQGLANASSLQILTKDHLVKNGNLLSLLHR